MIEFKEKDFNLTKIRRESKLFNLVTEYKYFVYGLRQADNPPIIIEYYYDGIDENFEEKLSALVEFFKSNGVEVKTYSNSEDKSKISIGLRKDLRAVVNRNGKPLLASSVLSTIIYGLENRLDIEQLKKYKLSNIPKLEKIIAQENSPNGNA
jgi:hypothetical protein